MHIPDNYLSPATCAALAAAVAPVWAKAIRGVKKEVERVKMPMLGIGAAFSFLMMMFNIPLPGGTTGHAVGGTLLAVLIGPYAACISITVALLIQALFFGDGGILAFGANCFNMAFILPFTGYFIFKFIKERIASPRGELLGLAIGSYFGLNLAAFFTALEFGLQPLLFKDAAGLPLYCPYPLTVSIPAMMIPHLLVAGFIEVLFTMFIYSYVKKVSPGTIYEGAKEKIKAIYGLVVALICLSPIGLIAAGTAWGEWGAEEIQSVTTNGKTLGFTPKGMEHGFSFEALLPDYTLKGVPDVAAYILSAVAGVAILIIIFKIVGSILERKTEGA